MACLMSIFGQGGLQTLRTTPLMTQDECRSAMEKARRIVMPYETPSATGAASDGRGGGAAEPARG
jgi:hypothetical protein